MPLRVAVRIAGAVIGIAAGVALVVGPVQLWASITADPSAFAAALREPVTVILPAIEESTGTFTWIQGGAHGDVVLLLGVTAVVVSASSLGRPTATRGAVLIVVGVVTGWLALSGAPDLASLRDEAVSVVAPWAFAVRRSPDVLRPIFVVSRGPSIAIVSTGALAAIVGGVLVVVAARISPADDPAWTPWARFRPSLDAQEE